MDEVSKDERTSARSRGRSKKGTCAVKKSVFVRGRRFSATGLLTIDGMILNTVVEGSMTRDLFLEFLEFSVVCSHLSLRYLIWSFIATFPGRMSPAFGTYQKNTYFDTEKYLLKK
jgi:hypothetical protein